MTIQDNIIADQAAVAAAQAALDAANAALTADQAKFDAAQPHLSLLTQIEAELATVAHDLTADAAAALNAIVGNVTPLLEQMRALLLG